MQLSSPYLRITSIRSKVARSSLQTKLLDRDKSTHPTSEGMAPRSRFRLVEGAEDGSVETVLARVARRENGALERLYYLTSAILYTAAVGILGDAEDAAEVIQDTYVRIWNKAHTFDSERSKGMTWMTMIMRGICMDQLRKKKSRPANHTDLSFDDGFVAAGSVVPFDDGFRQAQMLEDVRAAFAQLTDSDQDLMASVLFRGDSPEALAARYRLPLGTVKSRIHRALVKLRGVLGLDHEA